MTKNFQIPVGLDAVDIAAIVVIAVVTMHQTRHEPMTQKSQIQVLMVSLLELMLLLLFLSGAQ